jgi:hypothetical protein
MIALLWFFLTLLASPFKSKSRLEAENAALRHQLTVLQRKVRGRVQLTNDDRLFLIQLYRWFPFVDGIVLAEGPTLPNPNTFTALKLIANHFHFRAEENWSASPSSRRNTASTP